ncbi:hypothetical protein nbrc107696_14830 [Gordonia spumicola]|uniref:RDD domain-containing protein n=1 Tax=Gordonia spumicola TaxID=589161 RepID=A0A7I9V6W4_9ACTN|nr:RDD family protein [Gordonia spumicola]GEE01037.1 hypothetical protein nbrc107696_14830 [Gordonia spumicola]
MTDTAAPAEIRDAGIVTRSIAAGIDFAVVILLMGIGYLAAAMIMFAVDVREFHFPAVLWIFTATGFFVTSVLYLLLCWSVTGRTVGYAFLGLRLTTTSGARVPVVRIVPRALFCVAFPFGLAWVALSPKRKSLQDIVLRTRVVFVG